MTNVLKGNGNFFTVPRALVDTDILGKLSKSGMRLYLCLMGLAQKHSAVVIELSREELRSRTGIGPAEAVSARRELVRHGLIADGMQPGKVARYILLNPETKGPLPAPEGHSGLRRAPKTKDAPPSKTKQVPVRKPNTTCMETIHPTPATPAPSAGLGESVISEQVSEKGKISERVLQREEATRPAPAPSMSPTWDQIVKGEIAPAEREDVKL